MGGSQGLLGGEHLIFPTDGSGPWLEKMISREKQMDWAATWGIGLPPGALSCSGPVLLPQGASSLGSLSALRAAALVPPKCSQPSGVVLVVVILGATT